MNTKKEEANLINIQVITSILFIISIIVSIFLNLNEKRKILDEETYLSNDASYKILRYNRIFVTVLFFIYLYVSYKEREIDKNNNEDLTADNLELFVSILSVISGLIILYVIYKYRGKNDEEIITDNPTI